MKILLPPVIDRTFMIRGPEGGWGWDLRDEELTVASSAPLKLIEPVALSMLSAWGEFHRTRLNNTLQIDPSTRGSYAYKVGLLSVIAGHEAVSRLPGIAAPVVLFFESDLRTGLDDTLSLLRIAHSLTEGVLEHCLEDLCRNVFHHAKTHGGGAHVSASYHKKTRRVQLGVADCGCGIARDIKDHFGDDLNDVEAVTAALEPKVSGSRTPGMNMGVGLYVIRRLVLAARGTLWIHTGDVLAEASARSSPRLLFSGPSADPAGDLCGAGRARQLLSSTGGEGTCEAPRR